MSSVETSVRLFYDKYGWAAGGEDELFRDFRPAYAPYHQEVVARTRSCFDGMDGRLLIVGGGDIPASHAELAAGFAAVTCIDISEVALEITRSKLPQASTVLGSICEAPLESGGFDAIFAAHVIYHIDAAKQETAIREIIRLLRPGGRAVVLYSNPGSPIRYLAGAVHKLRRRLAPSQTVKESGLYFSPHRLGWWDRFEDQVRVSMRPWDVIGSYEERTLIGSDAAAERFYGLAGRLERRFPALAVRLWQYPIVCLDKPAADA